MKDHIRIAKKLLELKIICAYQDHDDYQTLAQDDVIKEKVELILNLLDRELVCADSGNSFYAVNSEMSEDTSKEAREYFRFLVNSARFYIEMLEFFAEACERDIHVQPGEKIYFHELTQTLTHNNALQDRLKSLLQSKSEKDINKMTQKFFDDMVKDELIFLHDSKNLVYRFTGKLELIKQGLTFIAEQNRLIEENKPDIDQMSMPV